VAFDRAQVQAMLRHARLDLKDLDRAAQRVVTGEYRVCERCGGPISAGRLTARPAARTGLLDVMGPWGRFVVAGAGLEVAVRDVHEPIGELAQASVVVVAPGSCISMIFHLQ
jgi:hypothetical protein